MSVSAERLCRTAMMAGVLAGSIVHAAPPGNNVKNMDFKFAVADKPMFHPGGNPLPGGGRYFLGVDPPPAQVDLFDGSALGPLSSFVGAFVSANLVRNKVGFEFFAEAGGGSVSASAPYSMTFSSPPTAQRGGFAIISSTQTLGAGFQFTTQAPVLTAGMDLVINIDDRIGFGGQLLSTTPYTTGTPETSIPNPAPQSMLDAHRNDLRLGIDGALQGNAPGSDWRKNLFTVSGNGNFGTGIPGVSLTSAMPPTGMNVQAGDNVRSGNSLSSVKQSTAPLIGMQFSGYDLFSTFVPVNYLGFNLSADPPLNNNSLSGTLLDLTANAGIYAKQTISINTGAGVFAEYFVEGTQVGHGYLGESIALQMPDRLGKVDVDVRLTLPAFSYDMFAGLALGGSLRLELVKATARALGKDLLTFGPLLTFDLLSGTGDLVPLFGSGRVLNDTRDEAGVAWTSMSIMLVPTPGTLGLLLAGGLYASRRRRM